MSSPLPPAPPLFNIDAPFGAVGDGVTNSGAAIVAAYAAALAAAAASSTGFATVIWPGGTYLLDRPIPQYPNVVTLSFGAAVAPYGNYDGDCFVYQQPGGARYARRQKDVLPSVLGLFSSGLHFYGNTVQVDIEIPYIGSPTDAGGPKTGPVYAILAESVSDVPIYGLRIRFNQIRGCTYGFRFNGSSTNKAHPAVLQGVILDGAFMDQTTFPFYFTETAQPGGYENFNVIDNYFDVKSVDCAGIDGVAPQTGSCGITFDTAVFDGGSNLIKCESFFGNMGPGGCIAATNGGLQGAWEFDLAPYAFSSNAYGDFAGLINGNTHSICKVNGVSGYIARNITANTAPNTRDTFDAGAGGGIPIYANRYDVKLPVPDLAAGESAVFYVYHPLTTGVPNSVKAYPRSSEGQPLVITDCVDQSVTAGITGPNPNEIAIRVTAFGTVAACAMWITVEVGL